MSYVLRTRSETGYLGMNYVRVENLKAGLVKEELLGVTAVQLGEDEDWLAAQAAGLHLPTHFETALFSGSDPTLEITFDEEFEEPDLRGLVVTGIAAWSRILADNTPVDVVTMLDEQWSSGELTRNSGLVVFDPELAHNGDGVPQFERYTASPDEIAAIERVQSHITFLITQAGPEAPGQFL